MSRAQRPPRGDVVIDRADVPLLLAVIVAAKDYWDNPRFHHRARLHGLAERLAASVNGGGGR